MSGGSFDYLYCKDLDELLTHEKDIQKMADALAEIGEPNATAAAIETQRLLTNIRIFKTRINAGLQMLQPVWKAMEWWKSGDHGKPEFDEALEGFVKPSLSDS